MEKPNIYSPFFNTMGFASSHFMKVSIKLELERAIAGGEGKDGTALDMVIGACFADGQIYTDGECLDLVKYIIEVWNEIGDEGEAS